MAGAGLVPFGLTQKVKACSSCWLFTNRYAERAGVFLFNFEKL